MLAWPLKLPTGDWDLGSSIQEASPDGAFQLPGIPPLNQSNNVTSLCCRKGPQRVPGMSDASPLWLLHLVGGFLDATLASVPGLPNQEEGLSTWWKDCLPAGR